MFLEPDPRWTLTRQALDRLLRHLDEVPEAAAREYEVIRRKLVAFFEMRGVPSSEALADETIDRVARRLDEGEAIEHPRAYFYGVAKRVALESEKRRARERAAIEGQRPLAAGGETTEWVEARAACLERCLRDLPPDTRALILGYYQGAGLSHLEDRELLAKRLGITYGTLKTRAHRIRGRLEGCLQECLRAQKAGDQ